MNREDDISSMAMDAIGGLMAKLPMLADRTEAVGILLIASYNLLRSVEGDEYMKGWLESALQDVKSRPSPVQLKGAN